MSNHFLPVTSKYLATSWQSKLGTDRGWCSFKVKAMVNNLVHPNVETRWTTEGALATLQLMSLDERPTDSPMTTSTGAAEEPTYVTPPESAYDMTTSVDQKVYDLPEELADESGVLAPAVIGPPKKGAVSQLSKISVQSSAPEANPTSVGHAGSTGEHLRVSNQKCK